MASTAEKLNAFLKTQSGTFGMKNGGEAISTFLVTRIRGCRNMVDVVCL